MNKATLLLMLFVVALPTFICMGMKRSKSKPLDNKLGKSFLSKIERSLGCISQSFLEQKKKGNNKGLAGLIGYFSYLWFLHFQFGDYSEKKATTIIDSLYSDSRMSKKWIQKMLRFVNYVGFNYDFSSFIAPYKKEPSKHCQYAFYLYIAPYVEFLIKACEIPKDSIPSQLGNIREAFWKTAKKKTVCDRFGVSYLDAKEIVKKSYIFMKEILCFLKRNIR